MTSKNPRPLTQPRKGEPNHGKFCAQPGSLHTTDLPMQPSLAEQLRGIEEDPRGTIIEISLSGRFPQLPADATMADRLMRDEEMLKYINGDPE